jgi:hypothetical protein
VAGNQNGFAFVGKAAEDFYDFVGAFGIYRVGWFIGQENLRIVDEGAGYENSMIFAAGESGRIVLSEVGDA